MGAQTIDSCLSNLSPHLQHPLLSHSNAEARAVCMAAITLQTWMHSSKGALTVVAAGQISVSSMMQTVH